MKQNGPRLWSEAVSQRVRTPDARGRLLDRVDPTPAWLARRYRFVRCASLHRACARALCGRLEFLPEFRRTVGRDLAGAWLPRIEGAVLEPFVFHC